MVMIRTTGRGFRRRQQRAAVRPALVGQLEVGGAEQLDLRAAAGAVLSSRLSGGMALFGSGLMTEGRPGKPKGEAFRRLGEGAEQPAHFRHRLGQQIA